MVHILLLEWIALTGGPSGFGQIPTFELPGYPLRSDRDYYYLVLACVVVVVVLALNLVRSRIGRALRGLHESEIAAETLGLDTASLKLRVFVLSAVFAGCAGSLYAHYVSYISPALFTFTVSVELLVMAAVGGLSSVLGALFGTAPILGLIQAIKAWLPLILPQTSGEQELILYGLILIVVMVFMPDGVIGTLEQRLESGVRRRERIGNS